MTMMPSMHKNITPIAAAVHVLSMSGCSVSGFMHRVTIRPMQYIMLNAMHIAIAPIRVFIIIIILTGFIC